MPPETDVTLTPEPTTPPAAEPATDASREGDAPDVTKLTSALHSEREARKASDKPAKQQAAELEELRRFRQELEDRDKTEADKAADKAVKAETKAAELTGQVATLQAERDALAEIVEARVKADIKDWPVEVKALIPEDGDLLTRLGAIDKARAIAVKLMSAPKVSGNGSDPRPLGAAGTEAHDERIRRAVSSDISRHF